MVRLSDVEPDRKEALNFRQLNDYETMNEFPVSEFSDEHKRCLKQLWNVRTDQL